MMEQLVEKMKVLKSVVVAVEKQFGKGAIMTLGDEEETEPVATISTGSLALDMATGVGGYPRGRVVEIYGPSRAARPRWRSTPSRRPSATAASRPSWTRSTPSTSATRAGLASRPSASSSRNRTRATGPRYCRDARAERRRDSVVVDSVAALTPKAEIEGRLAISTWGSRRADEPGAAQAHRRHPPDWDRRPSSGTSCGRILA